MTNDKLNSRLLLRMVSLAGLGLAPILALVALALPSIPGPDSPFADLGESALHRAAETQLSTPADAFVPGEGNGELWEDGEDGEELATPLEESSHRVAAPRVRSRAHDAETRTTTAPSTWGARAPPAS